MIIFNKKYCEEQLCNEIMQYVNTAERKEEYKRLQKEYLKWQSNHKKVIKKEMIFEEKEVFNEKNANTFFGCVVNIDPSNFSRYSTHNRPTLTEDTLKRLKNEEDIEAEIKHREKWLERVHVWAIRKCFGAAPICLDVEAFQRKLLISSNQLFNSNEKSCLAVMVDRWQIGKWWTAEDILDAIKKERESWGKKDNSYGFKIKKIEDCLNKHRDDINNSLKLYDREQIKEIDEIDENKCHYRYRVRLTDLIKYVDSDEEI